MFRTNKHLHSVLLVTVATLFMAQPNFAQSSYRFQHFGTKDGLEDDFVLSIAQDSLGYMWFQYFAGMTRFDGYNFKVYKYDRDDSLRSSLDFLLGGLRVDANRNIWVTKFGKAMSSYLTLARYDRETDGFIKIAVLFG
jgi:ligand-binding sensor domain-containing protein